MRRALQLVLLACTVGLSGCPEEDPPPPAPSEPSIPTLDAGARTGLHRLTADEWRNAAEDLLGHRWEGSLPEDLQLHGYTSVGAAEITVAPLDFEEYEAAAWGLAEQAVPDSAARDALLGCTATPPLGLEDQFEGPEACLRSFAVRLLAEAWRRPVSGEEADALVALYSEIDEQTARPTLAVQAMVAAALTAPDFLFRVELGTEHEDDAGRRWLTDHEQAARLALVLLDRPPEENLRALAEEGRLSTEAEVEEAAALAWTTPGAEAASTRFFSDWMDLDRIALTSKDPEEFPEWTDELKAGMTAEAELLFRDVAITGDGDLRQLLTTRSARLTPELAALYGVPEPTEPLGLVELPPERAGLLTRGAFLASRSHASLTSPTLRGKFVRTQLLCQEVPPPPEGVIASLEELNTEGTLREQLEQHMDDDACRSCHARMDPIGFAFEHFDPVGAWREEDRGFPVDATSELNGVEVDGGADIGEVLTESTRLPGCITLNTWAHLLGHIEQHDEYDAIDGVTDEFEAGGHRLSQLAVSVAGTIDFRTVRTPEGGACTEAEEGSLRSCSTACSEGSELCTGGRWTECSADLPERESCNGLDDDCDGAVDEDVVRTCDLDGLSGLESCTDGTWGSCVAWGGWETCNGLDDDGDGLVDEDLAVDFRSVTSAELAAQHAGCVPGQSSTWSDTCRAAVNRTCASTSCSVSGIGPVAVGDTGEVSTVACLSPEEAIVHTLSYLDLTAQHEACTAAAPFSPACNAAINRWCATQGQVTGYGPVEHSGDVAVVLCNPGATVYGATFTEVSAFQPLCNGAAQRAGEQCDEAYHRFCRDQGHRTGHGPLEHNGDDVWVACIGAL